MKIVVDTNVIFSMLITKNSRLRSTFFNIEGYLFAPDYIFIELLKHKTKFLKYSQFSEIELAELIHRIFQKSILLIKI
ncbi:MAG: hypothetical protein B6244_01795 [Candidatus Cloacimonetes bacterium 4572_55]|nr:MAG: hypothetical protein B6244_01795 [Candidatus Cloacimonetes bacterium 4572_55]